MQIKMLQPKSGTSAAISHQWPHLFDFQDGRWNAGQAIPDVEDDVQVAGDVSGRPGEPQDVDLHVHIQVEGGHNDEVRLRVKCLLLRVLNMKLFWAWFETNLGKFGQGTTTF